MKFTLLDYDLQTEHESDYETAVEMSHSSISESIIRLRSETGAILVLRENLIESRSSFLEPDLEQFKKDGSVVYHHQSDDQASRVSRSVQGYLESVSTLPAMSENDWQVYRQMEALEEWENEGSPLSDEQRRTLRAYADYEAEGLINAYPGGHLTQEQAIAWFDALPSELAQGDVVDLPVPENLAALFQEAGVKTKAAIEANRQTQQANQINDQACRAKQALTETVNQARRGFGLR